jgi:hypothetical protein
MRVVPKHVFFGRGRGLASSRAGRLRVVFLLFLLSLSYRLAIRWENGEEDGVTDFGWANMFSSRGAPLSVRLYSSVA